MRVGVEGQGQWRAGVGDNGIEGVGAMVVEGDKGSGEVGTRTSHVPDVPQFIRDDCIIICSRRLGAGPRD